MTTTTLDPRAREARPEDVRAWLESGGAALIDVREADEAASERIDRATLMPLSRFDVSALPSGRIVFHCATGPRSREAAARVSGRDEIYTLAGGLREWKRAGLPTERTAGVPISIMRQVQITAGAVILVCSLLAVIVSVWFALVAAFMGAGLVFAGSTGTCGMAAVLSRMPWNAVLRAGCEPKK
jgi:rhodanese-related sulfurtransferase